MGRPPTEPPDGAPPPGATHDGLIRALAAGDPAAVEALYRRHGSAVFNLAWQLGGDRAVAEDALHDVFVRLIEGAGRHRIRDLRAYLRTATLHRTRDLLRRPRTVSVEGDHRDDDRSELPEPVDAASSAERVAEVARALGRLPIEQREVVVLHLFEGLTFRQIGSELGLSANTAMSRYRYAKDALRRSLGRLDPDHVR